MKSHGGVVAYFAISLVVRGTKPKIYPGAIRLAAAFAGRPNLGKDPPMPLPRKLAAVEIAEVLSAIVPLHLGTVDSRGYPHVTPLWFCYEDGALWMTSLPSKPHVRRLRANQRASVCIDLEDVERFDGQRPNRQVRVVGDAALSDDVGGMWTRRITQRYILGEGRSRSVAERMAHPRVVIRLDAADVIAVSSV